MYVKSIIVTVPSVYRGHWILSTITYSFKSGLLFPSTDINILIKIKCLAKTKNSYSDYILALQYTTSAHHCLSMLLWYLSRYLIYLIHSMGSGWLGTGVGTVGSSFSCTSGSLNELQEVFLKRTLLA